MPRDRGGIGRTGRKHKKKSEFDVHRQPKAELVGESSSPGQEAASMNEEELEEAAAVLANTSIDSKDEGQAATP
jgi:hypothetical protein